MYIDVTNAHNLANVSGQSMAGHANHTPDGHARGAPKSSP